MGAHINKLSDRFVVYRQQIYVILENVKDTDFICSEKEVRQFEGMWRKKIPLKDIAEELDMTEETVFLLAIDRLFRGYIKPRKGWSFW